jgi:hypothetical protein
VTISHACATFCIQVPMLEVSAPNQSNRKLRWVKATVMRWAACVNCACKNDDLIAY